MIERPNADPWCPFPVLTDGAPIAGTPQTVPWWWIQQFERRVKENHGQTLVGLALRGGLAASEIWCAFHDKPLRDAPKHHVDSWLAVAVPTPPAPAGRPTMACENCRCTWSYLPRCANCDAGPREPKRPVPTVAELEAILAAGGEGLAIVAQPDGQIRAEPEPSTRPTFEQDLRGLINRHSIENASDTPDYMLAKYVCAMLKSFAHVVQDRDRHYGLSRGIPMPPADPNAPTPDTNPSTTAPLAASPDTAMQFRHIKGRWVAEREDGEVLVAEDPDFYSLVRRVL